MGQKADGAVLPVDQFGHQNDPLSWKFDNDSIYNHFRGDYNIPDQNKGDADYVLYVRRMSAGWLQVP